MKRLLAGPLWLMTGWYAGSIIAIQLGLSEALAPILGVAAAGIVVADPRRIIWTRGERRVTSRPQPESI